MEQNVIHTNGEGAFWVTLVRTFTPEADGRGALWVTLVRTFTPEADGRGAFWVTVVYCTAAIASICFIHMYQMERTA